MACVTEVSELSFKIKQFLIEHEMKQQLSFVKIRSEKSR